LIFMRVGARLLVRKPPGIGLINLEEF